jgi:hypothetical protein
MGLYEILGAGAGVVLIDLVIRVVALIIIPRDRLPTAAMAWLLAVFFIPVIGVLLFLLIGNPKLPERRRRKQQEMDAIIARESETLMPPSPQDSWPAWLPPVVTLTRNLTAMPLVGGNDARLRPERLHGDGDDQCQHEGSDEAGGAAQTGHHDHGAGAPPEKRLCARESTVRRRGQRDVDHLRTPFPGPHPGSRPLWSWA